MKDFLKEYRLPAILSDLQRSLKTGVLKYKHDLIAKKVYIERGEMIFAASNQKEDRFGDMLLREGKITKEDFDRSSELLRETGKRQGVILVEMGCLTPEETARAVIHQVELIILSLFSIKGAEYEFSEGPLPTREIITLKLSTGKIIYRGIKKFLEQNEYTGLPLDSVPGISDNPFNLFQDVAFSEEDRELLTLVDGKTALKEIISSSGMSESVIIRSAFVLLSISIIEILDEIETREGITAEDIMETRDFSSEHAEKIESVYRDLINLDYYGLLEVAGDSPFSEIKKSFYRLAREYHPDRNIYLPVDMKDKLNEIFTCMTDAFNVLRDPELRSRYDLSPAKVKKGAALQTGLAEEKFFDGMAEYEKENFNEASQLFGAAAYVDDSIAKYHFHLGLSLLGEDKLRESEAAMRKAYELDPRNDEIAAELGYIYFKLGFNLRAKRNFEKALGLNPSNKKAKDFVKMLPPK